MEYTPVNWELNDLITKEKMNHMDNGIAQPLRRLLQARKYKLQKME